MSITSLQDLIDKFETGQRPYGEDFASLIEACYDSFRYVDGLTMTDDDGTLKVNIDGVTLIVNEDGKLEATQVTGAQGPIGLTGPKGEPGEDGRDGNSFIVSKVYNSTEQMNLDFYGGEVKRGQFVVVVKENTEDDEHGDVYIKGTTQYDYLNNIKDADGIKGERGPAGPVGPKGDPGNTIGIVDNFESDSTQAAASARLAKTLRMDQIAHETMPADKLNHGHVKVGEGLEVYNGTISVPTKGFLLMRRTSNLTISSGNTNILFNYSEGVGISSNNSNGQFTLQGGKYYRVTAGGKVGFGGSGDAYCIIVLHSHRTASNLPGQAVYVPLNRNSAEASCGPYDTIVMPAVTGNYSLRVSGLVGTITFDSNAFTLIVQEL